MIVQLRVTEEGRGKWTVRAEDALGRPLGKSRWDGESSHQAMHAAAEALATIAKRKFAGATGSRIAGHRQHRRERKASE